MHGNTETVRTRVSSAVRQGSGSSAGERRSGAELVTTRQLVVQEMSDRNLMPGSLARWLPALAWLLSYDRAWFRLDAIAGLTAAAVVVPQAMAYGSIAGLPLVVGLYAALVPLLVYAVMGTSRPLSVTTTSTIAILTGHALQEAAPGGTDASLLVATGALACLVGGILLVASL